jgi:hypothetical protein
VIRINSRDFRTYILAALSDLYANFTLFLLVFGANNDIYVTTKFWVFIIFGLIVTIGSIV